MSAIGTQLGRFGKAVGRQAGGVGSAGGGLLSLPFRMADYVISRPIKWATSIVNTPYLGKATVIGGGLVGLSAAASALEASQGENAAPSVYDLPPDVGMAGQMGMARPMLAGPMPMSQIAAGTVGYQGPIAGQQQAVQL